MSSWFDQLDLGSLQDQLTKSVTEAQSLIGNVNNLDILNFDGMALQEEEDLKLEEEEEDEDEEQGVDEYIDENLQISEHSQVNSSSDDFVPIPTVIHENSSGHFGRSKNSKSVVRKLEYTDADREESPPQYDEDNNTNYNSPENVLLNTHIASTFTKDVSSNLPQKPTDYSDIPVEIDGIDGEDQQSNSSSSLITGATTFEYDSSGTNENMDMKCRDKAMGIIADTNERKMAGTIVDIQEKTVEVDSKVKQDSQTASTPAALPSIKSKYSSVKRASTTIMSTPIDPHLTENIQTTATPDFEYILPERHSTMPLRSIAKTNNMAQSPADIIADKSSKKGSSSVTGIEVQPKREKVKKIKEKKPKNLDFWGTSSKKTLKFVAPTVHTSTSNDMHTIEDSTNEHSGSHIKPHFSQISVGMLSDVYEAVVECDEDDDIQQQPQQQEYTDNNTEYMDSNAHYGDHNYNDMQIEGVTTSNFIPTNSSNYNDNYSCGNSNHMLNTPQHYHTPNNDNSGSSLTSSVTNSAVSIYASMFSSNTSDSNNQSSSSASKYQSPSQPSTTPANTNSSSNSSSSYIVNSFSFFDKVDTEIDLESDPIYNKVKANKQLPAATNMANAASMLKRLYASAAQTYHGRTLHPNVDGIVGTEQNPTIYQIFNNIVSNVSATAATDNVSAGYSNGNGNGRQATLSNNSNNNSNNNLHDDTEAADIATLQSPPTSTSTTLNRAALRTLLLNYLKHCLLYIWDHMFTTEGISVITGLLLFYSYYKFQRYGTDAGDR